MDWRDIREAQILLPWGCPYSGKRHLIEDMIAAGLIARSEVVWGDNLRSERWAESPGYEDFESEVLTKVVLKSGEILNECGKVAIHLSLVSKQTVTELSSFLDSQRRRSVVFRMDPSLRDVLATANRMLRGDVNLAALVDAYDVSQDIPSVVDRVSVIDSASVRYALDDRDEW